MTHYFNGFNEPHPETVKTIGRSLKLFPYLR